MVGTTPVLELSFRDKGKVYWEY